MKRVNVIVAVGCLSVATFAGDTNFVAQFDVVWKTHNASNILMFVEQNVATNKSPETLFARGIVAIMLQEWGQGATNYFEQVTQMITTNNAYTEIGKTNIIKDIQFVQFIAVKMTDKPLPSWNTNDHATFFVELATEPIFFDTLKAISTMK
jgi:hypothetical protein